jgi:hypothetical protein
MSKLFIEWGFHNFLSGANLEPKLALPISAY